MCEFSCLKHALLCFNFIVRRFFYTPLLLGIDHRVSGVVMDICKRYSTACSVTLRSKDNTTGEQPSSCPMEQQSLSMCSKRTQSIQVDVCGRNESFVYEYDLQATIRCVFVLALPIPASRTTFEHAFIMHKIAVIGECYHLQSSPLDDESIADARY